MKRFLSLAAVLFFFLFSSEKGAAQSWWQYKGLPDGGSIIDVAADNSGTVYVLINSSSIIYYSSDTGNTWQQVPGTFDYWNANHIAVNKETGTLYVGTASTGLFWTTDKGTTWHAQPFFTDPTTGFNANIYQVGTKYSGDTLVCNQPGLISTSICYTSSNAGATWATNTAPFLDANKFCFLRNGALLAGTEQGVFKSVNNGVSWSSGSIGLANFNISSIAEEASTGYLYAGAAINELTTDSSGCGIYRSTDGGATWTNLSAGITDRRITAIEADSATGKLYAASPGGIYTSADHGITWTLTVAGLTTKYTTTLTHNAAGVFSGSQQSGVAFASNPATGWAYRNNGISIPSITDMLVSRSGDIHLIDFGIAGIFHLQSDNWQTQINGLDVASGKLIARDKQGNLFASLIDSNKGIYKSVDSGSTWVNIAGTMPIPAGVNFTTFKTIKFDTSGNIYTLATYIGSAPVQQEVFMSTDGGSTWSSLLQVTGASGFTLLGIDVTSGGNIYLAEETFSSFADEFYLSVDHGISFTPVAVNIALLPSAETIDVIIDHKDSLYFLQNNHVYKRMGINNWVQLPDGGWSTDISFHPIKIFFDNNNRLYVACKNNGIYYTDNDSTWTDISATIPSYTPPLGTPEKINLDDIGFDGSNTPYALATDVYSGSLKGVYKFSNPPSTSVPGAINKQKLTMEVYPNPVSDKLVVTYFLEQACTVSLQLCNASGAIIYSINRKDGNSGNNQVFLDIAALPSGVYFLRLYAAGESNYAKIVKL